MNRLEQEGTGQSLPHFHVPVLPRETIGDLHVQPGGRYVDCTLGSGGHALAILEASAPGGQLLGIDADPQAISESRDRLSAYRKDILLVNDNFSNLKDICNRNNFHPVNGVLFDLGVPHAEYLYPPVIQFHRDAKRFVIGGLPCHNIDRTSEVHQVLGQFRQQLTGRNQFRIEILGKN